MTLVRGVRSMKHVIDELIELQELYYAQSEQDSLTSGEHVETLDQSIRDLTRNLPGEVASLCQRLRKKYLVVIVPVVNGVCSACGVTLPTSQIYKIESREEIYQCPSCSRILYSASGAPRQLKRVGSAGKPRSGIARFSSRFLMCPDMKANTREEALSELVHLMACEALVENPDGLLEAAIKRESIMTTAVNNGLAFPHVRGVEGGGLAFSLGVKKEGLAFEAPDGGRTYIIFFIVIPSAAGAFYLQLISGLIEAFQDESARLTLLESTTAEELWENLARLTEKTIP
jgi:mannitol/fructose-specific phosphotransferase system IIA component (Ntr-type)